MTLHNTCEALTCKNYFPTLQRFNLICKADSSLTPAAQLLFRILAEQANCLRWTDSFTMTLDEIATITHLSRQTIISARRQLKNKGYITFAGNPSRYTIYSLLDR